MSDLPLDETALQAAQQAHKGTRKRGKEALALAISTYLRGAHGLQRRGYDPHTGRYKLQRLVGPWEEIPVVQAESEEE